MSTFLSRMAARAVGAQASARPRAAALFESESHSEIEPRVGARPASPPPSPAAPPAPEQAHLPARATPPPAARRAGPDEPLTRALAAEPPRHPIEFRREVEVVSERLETATQARPVAAGEAAPVLAPRTSHPSAQAAPSARATPGATVPPFPAPANAPATEQPPEVRVHIGRLEVRANLQPAPAPAPRRREPERAPELSLSDYLRGGGQP